MNGVHFDWKSKVYKKSKYSSRTPGSQKGENCKANTKERFFAGRSRSYKHPEYKTWLVNTHYERNV